MALELSSIGGDVFTAFTSLDNIFYFLMNVVIWIGWGCVFVAVAYILFSLIQKLSNPDNEDAIKEFRGAILKSIIVSILGLLLLSVGFIYSVIAKMFGVTTVPFDLPF